MPPWASAHGEAPGRRANVNRGLRSIVRREIVDRGAPRAVESCLGPQPDPKPGRNRTDPLQPQAAAPGRATAPPSPGHAEALCGRHRRARTRACDLARSGWLMPQAPARPCRAPLCSGFAAREGYCDQHQRMRQARYNEQRGSSTAQGYGARWRKLRLLVLGRDPLCRTCQRASSTDVDHITPKRLDGTDTLENLQGLCGPCHARKTAVSDGRWG